MRKKSGLPKYINPPLPPKKKKNIEETRGRKPLYETPEQLQTAIDNYFDVTNTEKKTVTGLAYHLGFESRQSFYDYEKNKLFSYTIKRGRLRIEQVYESCLQGNNATGSIFALKNLGWHDKTEITGKDGESLIPPMILFKDFKNG